VIDGSTVKMAKEYGLEIVLAIMMAGMLFFIIRWILATTREILRQAKEERENWNKQTNEERENWRKIIDALKESVLAHNERAKNFSDNVYEAHKFQREEHQKMISHLGEINSTLGKINGYKVHGQ